MQLLATLLNSNHVVVGFGENRSHSPDFEERLSGSGRPQGTPLTLNNVSIGWGDFIVTRLVLNSFCIGCGAIPSHSRGFKSRFHLIAGKIVVTLLTGTTF